MKIDKHNPLHWLYLLLFGLNALLAWCLRPLWRRRGRKVVVLYGHKLAGNLLALYRRWRNEDGPHLHFVFLTMDPVYYRRLLQDGIDTVLTSTPRAIALLARADAVVSDHGLHAMSFLAGHSSIQFFDVWHGIMFKGFAPQDFRVQHRYAETWVASPLLQQLYVRDFGFDPARVHVTGYARTDCLVRRDPDQAGARKCFELPATGPIVLFAPTWQRDPGQHSIYPFGASEEEFMGALSALVGRLGATLVMRAHLNTHRAGSKEWPHVIQRPFADWPDAEALLLACDVLVCDWSSIAFDWLLLERPTLFLDVPIPTPRGFALGPEYRFGDLVGSLDALLASLEQAITDPAAHLARFAAHRVQVLQDVYGGRADGNASARCLERLRQRLS